MLAARDIKGFLHGWWAPAESNAGAEARFLWNLRFFTVAAFASRVLTFSCLWVVTPEIQSRIFASLSLNFALMVAVLLLSYWGRGRLAGMLLVGGLMSIATAFAWQQGGLLSPGIVAFFYLPVLAGTLFGRRATLVTALFCAVLGTILAVGDVRGWLPPQAASYTPITRLILFLNHAAFMLLVVGTAIGDLARSLSTARLEQGRRHDAEWRLDRVLEAAGIGVWEYAALQRAFSADKRAFEIFGRPRPPDGRFSRDDWASAVAAPDLPRVSALLDRLTESDEAVWDEHWLRTLAGEQRHVRFWAAGRADPLNGDRKVVGLSIDDTALKAAAMERERLVVDLGERVKELRLLHQAAQLLRNRRFEPRILDELAALIPPAWFWPEICAARIVYKDHVASTAAWQETPWKLSAPFRTDEGAGRIEVIYTEARFHGEAPFLAEERSLLDSVTEMLATYLQGEEAEHRRIALEQSLRQTQKLEALGTLAGGVAHDFNNILTSISLSAELGIQLSAPGSDVRHTLEQVAQAGARGKSLVNRILLFTRQQAPVRESLAIGPLIVEIAEMLRPSLPEGVKLKLECPSDLPPIHADVTQMHQVLLNLGTNAIYAMTRKGGELGFRAEVVEIGNAPGQLALAPGRYLSVTVRDTGSGIPPEVLDRIFEPFFTTKGNEGTGLGLSVVHGIIKEHGGQISVSSRLGAGTTFQILLPLGLVVPAAASQGRGQHVLYVDDEEALADVISHLIELDGYRCTTFTDPRAALAAIEAGFSDFDMLISDLNMPGMSGIELLRAVRALKPELPVALFSGYIDENSSSGKDLEGVRWVQKPPSIAAIRDVLQQLVRSGTH